MILKSSADDLPLVIQILRPDEADNAVDEERVERPRNSISPRFQRQLIDSVMCLRGKSATLAGFEIHRMIACPADIALSVMLENPFAAFTQHGQSNSEASVRRFCPCNGLEKKIDRHAPIHCGQLRCDMRQATGLCGDLVGVNQATQ